jgi:NAD(P)-dependent dehydrogenase (short-subunit alcohol dehydrogenase family)
MRLKSKLAVVTAGASGMGRAGCLRFAEEGVKVSVIDLNERGAADVTGIFLPIDGGCLAE